ncbi:MAG: DUF692 family protein [Deltaproteobacteria bacterium]|nr:DUF692 family protein [Deltaproteobacteria bacterium]
MSSPLQGLPILGVGASLSLEARPDPAALAARPGGPSFVEYASKACFEAVGGDVARVKAAGARVLFHPSYINFCGTFPNAQAWLDETARHISATGSPWFAQDVAYCGWEGNPGYSTQFGFFLPPLLTGASLEAACERVREVMARVPVQVALEPPPFNFVVGDMGLLRFFGALAERTDAALLLDAGHLVSWEVATGLRVADDAEGFPWHRVVELHVAGGKLEAGEGGGAVYVDAHEQAVLERTWDMFRWLLGRATQLRAVCFECEGATEEAVMATLARVRGMVLEHGACPALVEKVQEELRGVA